MRQIKYISIIFIFIIINLFIGDMYIWNLDSFETEYISTTMYLHQGVTQEQMLQDIVKTAEKHACSVFVVDRNIENIHSESVHVYSMKEAERQLAKKSYLKQGEYKSMFLGNVKVRLEPFENVPDVQKIENYYLTGTMENAMAFKSELVDRYDGNFPKQGYRYTHSRRNIVIVWTMATIFLLILTMYETILLKKETAIRFIYGDSLKLIALKKIIQDILFSVGVYTVVIWGRKYWLNGNINYCFLISGLCLGVYCLVNSLIYLQIIFASYTSSFMKGNKKILNVSYVYKTIVVVTLVLVMSTCSEMIFEGVSFWKQKDFFEQNKNYAYLSISSADGSGETTEKMMQDLLQTKQQEGQTILNVYMDRGIYSGKPCLMYDRNSTEYLQSRIPEIKGLKLENEIYFIVPEKNKDTYIQDLEMLKQMYIGEDIPYKVITYKTKCSVIGIQSQNGIKSRWYRSPLIILNGKKEMNYYNGIYFSQACMVNIADKEWEEYVAGKMVDSNTSYKTNVYDNFKYLLKEYQRKILLGSMALIIYLLLLFLISRTILRYESMINSVELAVKSVVGYSVVEKYKKMYLITFLPLGIGAIINIIISVYFQTMAPLFAITGSIAIAGMETIIITCYIRKHEKVSIQKALKGSVL